MKRVLFPSLLLASSIFVTSFADAQSQGMGGMDMKGDMKGMDMNTDKKAAKGTVHKATGVVTKVDAAKNKVTIRHEPVQSMKWPAMNMAFTVKDKATLDKLPKDGKVEFEFVQEGKDYVITSVK
jgi:Cu(I)/Ag(I) efflux system protein CusF